MKHISVFEKLQINLKREYWEYRKLVWGVPIIMSVLFVLAAIAAIVFSRFADEHKMAEGHKGHSSAHVAVASSAELKQLEQLDQLSEVLGIESEATPSAVRKDSQHTDGDHKSAEKRTEFRFMGMYMFVAWLSGFYYLLSSLYTDRRDKSVLYWKSLPVSETENVLSKLLFGSLAFSVAAVIMAWITSVVLLAVMHGLTTPEELANMRQDSDFAFNATQLFVWPIWGLIFGLLWGAPVFAYILMVSAMSKRLPFMLLIVPPIILLILEGIFFGSGNLVGFLIDHVPAKALFLITQSTDAGSVFATFFGENGASLVVGLLLASGFLYTAIWYRNKRFEI
jgi:ABC-2 type transport system permease protein